MSVEAAADRLPWLADEPASQPIKRRRENLWPWAGTLIAVVAAGGFWMGARSVRLPDAAAVHHSQPSTTVRLPPAAATSSAPLSLPTQPEVRPAPAPEVRPSLQRQVNIALPAMQRPAPRQTVIPAVKNEKKRPLAVPAANRVPPVSASTPAPQFIVPVPWNPRIVTGASGRLVQIGAFGTIHQAKHGWWFMVRDYPAMAHLPAVVRVTRNSRGRPFYRFDVGTTSQAHSEVLCQRMVRIRLSCAVMGLPWKAKVER